MIAKKTLRSEKTVFQLPKDVIASARIDSKAGVRIRLKPLELIVLMKIADDALDGVSNHAVRDALYLIRESLSVFYEDRERR